MAAKKKVQPTPEEIIKELQDANIELSLENEKLLSENNQLKGTILLKDKAISGALGRIDTLTNMLNDPRH